MRQVSVLQSGPAETAHVFDPVLSHRDGLPYRHQGDVSPYLETATVRDLRLHALRERFNLPRYKAHDALIDALATAELFCAFAAHRELGSDPSLRHFLSLG